MKFIGLDDKEYKKEVSSSKYPKKERHETKSFLQWEFGQIIEEKFPNNPLLEEVPCFGITPLLYLDFFVPTLKIAFEIQGDQHNKYNPFFHGSKYNFALSKKNDAKKAMWCEKNNITLIYLYQKDLKNAREIIDERCK